MREEVLYIGDVKVYSHPVILKCYGLGSCVGLFIKDRATGLAGAGHIFLPDVLGANAFGEGLSATDCVHSILNEMKRKGASLTTLRAKIVGGANPLIHFQDVGMRNTQRVLDALRENNVYVAAMDVGGEVSRTVWFDTQSELLIVHQLERGTKKIF